MEIKEYVALHKSEIKQAILKAGRVPSLAIITVGEDPASESYVRGKLKDAAEVGIKAVNTRLSETTSQEDLLSLIDELNADPTRSMVFWCSCPCLSTFRNMWSNSRSTRARTSMAFRL
jgi:5,10-methylene-tetrahydrofolate dehydrogenase/methenyl tetrahydrofolate cyclohydrolase